MFGHKTCRFCMKAGHKKDMVKRPAAGGPDWYHPICWGKRQHARGYKRCSCGAGWILRDVGIMPEPDRETIDKVRKSVGLGPLAEALMPHKKPVPDIPEAPEVKHERIRLGPDDVLVLKSKQIIPDKHMDAIQKQVKNVFGENFKAILLEEDIHIAAVIERPAKPDPWETMAESQRKATHDKTEEEYLGVDHTKELPRMRKTLEKLITASREADTKNDCLLPKWVREVCEAELPCLDAAIAAVTEKDEQLRAAQVEIEDHHKLLVNYKALRGGLAQASGVAMMALTWDGHIKRIICDKADLKMRIQELEEAGITAKTQDRIREYVLKHSGAERIDGSGCDSGDPVDFTLAEIGQGLIHVQDECYDVRQALIKYGSHTMHCREARTGTGPCSCGFGEACGEGR